MANEHFSLTIYSKYVLFITVCVLLITECVGEESKRRTGKRVNEEDEEVIVFSSAHKNRRESSVNSGHGAVRNSANRRTPDILSASSNHYISRVEFNSSDSSSLRESANNSKASLLEPFTRLLDSYFSSRTSNSSKNNNGSKVDDDISESRTVNETSSESRTLSSWLSETFGFPAKKKRPTAEESAILPYRNDVVSSSVTGFPVGTMLAPIFRPSFLPQPDGFPGPNNPGSVLLPADLLEATGVDYWLNYIENGGQFVKPASYEPTGSDAEEMNFFRRPVNYPIAIGQKLNSRRPPLPHPNHHNHQNHRNGHNNHRAHANNNNQNDDYQDDPGQDRYPEEEEGDNLPPDKPAKQQHTFESAPRCDKFTSHICVDDFEYPEQAIVDEIYKRRDIFELMYAEVKDNSPLVDGIPRHVEESYNYEHYFSPDGNDLSYPLASGSEVPKDSSGFICPSEVLYGKPKLARNLKGTWKVIVNAAEFTQTIRMEKCLKPNDRCNHVSNSKVTSRCLQVNTVHRLVVFEKGKGFYIDTFRIPTACSCHVSKRKVKPDTPSHGYHSNVVETVDKNVPPSQLTNALWSLLNSNGLNENHNYDSGSLVNNDAVRTQLALLQHIKNHPEIAGQITPENVLQQLSLQPGLTSQQYDTVPEKPSGNSYSGKYRPQKLSNGQYIIPGMYLAAEPVTGERVKTTAAPYPPFANYPQTHQATTFIRPGGSGAPVVQVIHVPVTSSNQLPLKPSGDGQNGQLHPVYQPIYQLSAYESKKSTKNSDGLNSTASGSVALSSTALPMIDHSKTNSSSTSTANMAPSDAEERRKPLSVKKIDKRINFSYHPILEYITMSTID